MNRVKVVYDGETVDADEMEFKAQAEAIRVYHVGDGAVIEIQHDVKNIYRLCDKKREDGSPIYLVTGTAILKTTRPETKGTEHGE